MSERSPHSSLEQHALEFAQHLLSDMRDLEEQLERELIAARIDKARLEEQLETHRKALQDIEAYFDHHFSEGDLEYQAVIVARGVLYPASGLDS